MFWKPKNSKDDVCKSLFSLSDEYQNEKRAAFRVAPIVDYPIVVTFDGHEMEVIDISAAGISCKGACSSHPTEDFITIQVNDLIPETTIEVKVVESSQSGCRLSFKNLSKKTKDQIHMYVLRAQKAFLKEKNSETNLNIL